VKAESYSAHQTTPAANQLAAFTPFTGTAAAGSTALQIVVFFLLGAVLGLCAAAFVWVHTALVMLVRKLQPGSRRAQMCVCCLSCLSLSVTDCVMVGLVCFE
jgi:hypothetical protein